VIVVVGLEFEARIAAGLGMQVVCAGIGRDLAGALGRAIRSDCSGLLSFGVCGGLAPHLKPGACIVASEVLSGRGRVAMDPHWSRQLLQSLPDAEHGLLLGVQAPLADTESKRTLHQETGALAADMESHIVASVAAERGLPVATIRVVTDPAKRPIPRAALAAMRSDGTVDMLAMLRALAKTPRDIGLLMRTALDARAAHATLRRSRSSIGPDLSNPHHRLRPHGVLPAFPLYGSGAEAIQPAE
jgi:adenosylhomocysteine nucleosidase